MCSLQAVWLNIEMAFGWLFLGELIAKLITYGNAVYWRKASNRFDMLVTLGVVITQVRAATNNSAVRLS